MSSRVIGIIIVALAVIAGCIYWVGSQQKPVVQPAPQVSLTPEVPSLDVELNNRFIERFIVEDKEIQAALRGETLLSEATQEAKADEWEKTNKDILFEQMAPWVYVNYRKINEIRSGRF